MCRAGRRVLSNQLEDFNLLATTHRGLENEASSELHAIVVGLGDSAPLILRTNVRGLIAAKTTISSSVIIDAVGKIVTEDPWRIRFLLRLIPIEFVVPTDLEAIVSAARQLVHRIAEAESFRVTVEKRRTGVSSKALIEAIAALVDRPVDLENPSWVVLVEVVGDRTGVSVTRPNQILSIIKLKRGDFLTGRGDKLFLLDAK